MSRQPREDHRLRRIVAEAATLWQRLAGDYLPVRDDESTSLAQARLAQWQERAARGDATLFQRRLAWLDTTPEVALDALGKVHFIGELPSWSHIFHEAMAAAAEASQSNQSSRHPFGDLLLPFALIARQRLAHVCRAVFSPEILDKLTDDLLRELSYIAAPAFYLEFSVFRGEHGEGATRYEAFTTGLLAGRLWDFFLEYPVLARLLSITVDLWTRNLSELAQSLEADLPAMQALFNDDEALGCVVDVRPSLSDRHNDGRTVTLLKFASGLELIHKPRDLGVERAWFALLEDCNRRGGDFRVLKVLTREGHGWVEAVRHAPCQNSDEARAYYRRAGMLLCMLYALEASDCFFENLIAVAGYPVLIDVETLMHHVLRRGTETGPADEVADDILLASVFRTGFLPSWEAGANGTCVDISGLGAQAGQVTPYQKRVWENVNTDAMRLRHEPITVDSEKHLPHLNGVALRAADYSEEIVAGFRRMYELLIEMRDELLSAGGRIDDLGQQEIRVLFHATRISGLLLKRLYAPRHLRSGVERSIETDVFSRFYLDTRDGTTLWPLLEAEIAAMERLDIPRFAVQSDSHSLKLPTGKTLENIFTETARERVRQRLRSLNRDDLQTQIGFIRAALQVSAIAVKHEPVRDEAIAERQSQPAIRLSADELIAEALRIAEEIESRAIFSADGSATWIAPQLLPRTARHGLRPLRMDLYNGLAGVALLFAALEHVRGTGRHTAMAALASLRKFITTSDTARLIREGYSLGAATGVGSFIYVLTRCAALLDEASLLDTAFEAAQRINHEWIAADDSGDAMAGAAGAILGLLALHRETADAAVLETAMRCGDHLLSRQEAAAEGAAWRAGNGKFMTGLSHGAAGIALALLRLYGASGERRFRKAAEQAIAFEDSVFDAAAGNWPDFRYATAEAPAFMNAWCHGAAGIGLARLASASVIESPAIRQDIQAALRKVSLSAVSEKDGLCCGNLGRADLLLAASCADRAATLASAVVERSRQSGGYKLSGQSGQDFFDPSFFQGISGIGYQLLRIAHPEQLPCVLVWE
ncbi:MAG TPA: type 2 lanthipeptide synthetase LanM family protein [Blastocatellia bacterium]|nr:type 2 lanthipeptide synthetase LanM family protein [Blastocatellia bacterium]